MKTTIKRMLTTALAITMVVTMIAMPVSAGPTDTRTFVLMNDDMSVNHVGYPTNNAEWINGNVWGYLWTQQGNIVAENGDTVVKALSTIASNKEAVIIKNVFAGSPINDAKSTVTITYDIKTSARTANNLQIINRVNDGGDTDIDMSSYNTKTGAFTHLGYIDSALKNSCILAENTEYILKHEFLYDEANQSHALKITVTDKADAASITAGDQQVSSFSCTSWNFYKNDITNFKSLRYRVYYQEQSSADIDGNVLYTFQNIKIEETVTGDILEFGSIAYNNYGVQFTGVSQTDVEGTVAADSAAGLAGYQWAATDLANLASSFVYENGTLVSYTAGDSSEDIFQRKFAPIKDGDTLKVSFDLKLTDHNGWSSSTTDAVGEISSIRLLGETTDLTMIGKGKNQYHWGYWLLHDSLERTDTSKSWKNITDENVKIVGTGGYNWYSRDTSFDQTGSRFEFGGGANGTMAEYSLLHGTIGFDLTAAPNADGLTYDITMTLSSGDGHWRCQLTATKNVSKETILDIDTLAICEKFDGTLKRETMRYSNISVETLNANAKTALAAGENTVYLPVENVTGHAADYAIVAAVYETGNEIAKDFAVATFTGNSKGSDKLAIEGVTITNPESEYVKLYVFDQFNTLEPHTMPISTIE